MKTAAASLLFLLAVPLLAFGQTDIRDKVIDGNSSVSQYNVGRMADLPTNEADKFYITLTTRDDWQSDPRQRQVAGWFSSDPRLAKYKSLMRWNWYTTSNPLFKERLQKSLGTNVPIVSIQKPNGDVVMNVTGLSMPHTAGELADIIADSVEAQLQRPVFEGQSTTTPIEREQCPDGRCPVQPQPRIEPNEQPALIPEILPKKRTVDDPVLFWALVIGAGVLFFGFVFVLLMIGGALAARQSTPAATSRPNLF